MEIRQGDRTFEPGDLATKAPAEILAFEFDWSDDLADGLMITDSAFTVTPVRPAVDTALTVDSKDVLYGDQVTRIVLSAGTLGSKYDVVNTITTNESPAQTLRAAVRVLIEI